MAVERRVLGWKGKAESAEMRGRSRKRGLNKAKYVGNRFRRPLASYADLRNKIGDPFGRCRRKIAQMRCHCSREAMEHSVALLPGTAGGQLGLERLRVGEPREEKQMGNVKLMEPAGRLT